MDNNVVSFNQRTTPTAPTGTQCTSPSGEVRSLIRSKTAQVEVQRRPRSTALSDVKLTTWSELQKRPFPERRFIIDPILRERQVGMIYAPAGVGKTWLTLSFAVAAASGQEAGFLGFHGAGEGVKVLFIDGEMDIEDLRNRLNLIVDAVGANPERVGRNLIIASRQDQTSTGSFPNIADNISQDALLRYCRDVGVKLLMLDNLSTLAPTIEDENSAAKMTTITTMMLKAKQAGVSCILVHHTNKSNESYRGSQVLTVTLDVLMSLKRPENFLINEGETAFVLGWEKVRGQIPRQIIQARTVVFMTKNGLSSWREDDHPASYGHEIKQLLETHRYATQKELAVRLGISEGQVSKRITNAIAAGIFTKNDLQKWLKTAKNLREASGLSEDEALVNIQGIAEEATESVTDGPQQVAPPVKDVQMDSTMF